MKKWSEMTPRERDALVAEKVMGTTFKRDRHEWDYELNIGEYCSECGTIATLENEGEECLGRLPHYTTDISAAWEVVEKMVAEGWEPSIEYSSRGYPWTVWMGHDALDAGVGHGDTVPSAICLSALRAVGVDI